MTDSMDWNALADREAAAIIMGASLPWTDGSFDVLQRFVALGWLQGAIYATHLDLADTERARTRLMEDLR